MAPPCIGGVATVAEWPLIRSESVPKILVLGDYNTQTESKLISPQKLLARFFLCSAIINSLFSVMYLVANMAIKFLLKVVITHQTQNGCNTQQVKLSVVKIGHEYTQIETYYPIMHR